MKIRRYIGNNTQEAILKVKMDLGNDAIILNTRKVKKKGIFKFFSKPLIEVLAAIDDDYGAKREKKAAEVPVKAQVAATQEQVNIKNDEKEGKIQELENKVSNMEGLMQKLYDQFKQTTAVPKTEEAEQSVGQAKGKEEYPKVLQVFYNNLIANEVDHEVAKKVIDRAKEKVGETAGINDAASAIHKIVSEMLAKPEVLTLKDDGKPTVVIFVGPTGVGKTTTLAKIAADFALNQKKNVGLITADTYRIAAVEQLKTYAEILGMPITVIYSANEIQNAIQAYSDKDLILIDTAGRSYNNKSQFEELKSLVLTTQADEVFLVMSTTTSMRICKEILSNYCFLENYRLIFTKLDETPVNGVILNSRHLTNKNLSYVTTGQCVPDDIEVANIEKITKNLLGSIN